jgi:hypothetical protein
MRQVPGYRVKVEVNPKTMKMCWLVRLRAHH